MQINDKIMELKKALPSGSFRRISENTGLSYRCVMGFFSGEGSPRLKTIEKIVPEAYKILKEVEQLMTYENE